MKTESNNKDKLFISGSNSPKIFDNKVMEVLTSTNHIVPFIFFIPVILYFLSETIYFIVCGQINQPLWLIPICISAVILWSIIEYAGHRFVFHYNAKSNFGKKILYIIHWAHHDYPNDTKRVVVPPVMSIIGGIFLYLMSYGLFGKYYASPFFCILVICYMTYDWFHYASHHLDFKNKYFQMIKKHHLLHHYKDPDNGFGFITTLWDHILKTTFKK